MKKYNNNTLTPVKKNSVALDLNSNNESKVDIELRHRFIFKKYNTGVRSVNVTTDNRFLIITLENLSKIRVVDLEKLEFLPHKYGGHYESVRLTSITKDNKAFYTASWDGSFRKFEIASGECTQVINGIGRSPSCYVDPKDKYLFTCSYNSDIELDSFNMGSCWDLVEKEEVYQYKHFKERKTTECIDIAYDQDFVYTGSDDGIAYKWDLKGGKPLLKYFEFEGSIRKVAISANYFAGACTDGYVRLHNKHSGELTRRFKHGESDIREVRISKDETKLWSAAEDGSVACYNLKTGDVMYHRKIHSQHIWSICLMQDEKILVTGSGDGSITFLSATSGQILAVLINLTQDNDFLIACPPDKAFSTGIFYTNNKDYIQVGAVDKKRIIKERLKLSDPRRIAYIDKLNLKNLVITRLKNSGHYTSLTKQYVQNKAIRAQVNGKKPTKLLKAHK
jgi:WD40 repeat protein